MRKIIEYILVFYFLSHAFSDTFVLFLEITKKKKHMTVKQIVHEFKYDIAKIVFLLIIVSLMI